MKITVQPSSLSGSINAPASKSSMQRACAAALLCGKKAYIQNPGRSNDDLAALDIIKKLGAVVQEAEADRLVVESSFLENSNEIVSNSESINCGESGLSIRMFTPIAALCRNKVTINGEGSLLTRPLDFFDEVLPRLGVRVLSNQGKLPIEIQGPLQLTDIEIDGSLSSQFLTGLLLAYAAQVQQFTADSAFSIKVNSLKSKPYIDLTLDVMEKFGLPVPINKEYKEFIFQGKKTVRPIQRSGQETVSYQVEGDWSGGAFLLVAGAIAGPVMVTGLSLNSTQADKKILDALMAANAGVAVEAKGIKVHPGAMNAFEFDATDCPDLFPPLVALAAYCKGVTKIKGVDRLAYKESDRGLTLQEEFAKMGLKIERVGDVMEIDGGHGLKGALVHSRHDHRIAMACAVAALKAAGATTIEEPMAIKKSYPVFFEDMETLGAECVSGLGEDALKHILFKTS